ncbi:MAG TPA: zinc-binding alcohol dehydrogenase [Polyangia bacterium]|jgi:2-desacetyl-2-hydroxyethyl bacteriochlorophyllide A dehydrogenase|nr:zinc-binding alcohol dehydrogenase [Polyangia bacterium]
MTRRIQLQFTAPGRIAFVEDALEAPPPGHALVRTLTSAISAGSELLAFRGQLASDTPLDETLSALGRATFAYPFPYGYASVGEVAALGSGVDPTWAGRRVFAFEPHATMFIAPVADLLPVPDGLDADRAVLLAQMETAINLVLDGAPLHGENVLAIGLGTVGLLTTALLSRFPLAVLAISDPQSRRTQAARALAARPIVEGADDIRRAFGARGADLVYELSGNPEALDDAIAAAGHEARLVVGSWYGSKRARVDLGDRFHRRRLKILSSQVSHIGAALSARWDRQRRFDAAWRALADIDTLPLVSHRVPFKEAQAAYELLDRNAGDVLQVLLDHRH